MVILKCGHGIGITPKQKDRPARLLLVNGLELYSVLLAALERSAMRFDLRREPQKDSCKAAQGKCSFPWDGIGLAHKRQLRFHRAVCKTAISHKGVPGKASKMILWGRGGTAERMSICAFAQMRTICSK